MKVVLMFALCCLPAVPAIGQQGVPATQMLDGASLRATGEDLVKQARAAKDGIAFKVLMTRPESVVQMAVRLKSGQAEWHRDDADLLIMLEGEAQVVTGGTVVGGKDTAPGEIRGESITGGTTQPFRAGDVLRIEPKTPHQVLLKQGATVRYIAIKSKPNR